MEAEGSHPMILRARHKRREWKVEGDCNGQIIPRLVAAITVTM